VRCGPSHVYSSPGTLWRPCALPCPAMSRGAAQAIAPYESPSSQIGAGAEGGSESAREALCAQLLLSPREMLTCALILDTCPTVGAASE